VTTIEKEAFKNCKSLKKIVIKSTKLKKVGKNAIKGIYKKAVITCKKKNLKAYKKLFSKKTGYKKTMKIKKG
ncbi:MAG: leucine-rich repeat domain-containing protein, partial [Lachnospiraceae bacterium]|nr:leucine-rich repeat domain-containing protein [Lachnospiraceae bacterium]